jgi:hypothetical protein
MNIAIGKSDSVVGLLFRRPKSPALLVRPDETARCALALILRGLMTGPEPPGWGPAGCAEKRGVALAAAGWRSGDR